MNQSEITSFIWDVADLIRDTFKRGKYQDVILPLTVLRRIDQVHEINFNRYFHEDEPPRPLEGIESDSREVEREIVGLGGARIEQATGRSYQARRATYQAQARSYQAGGGIHP